MKPPKISPCPRCRERTSEAGGPGIIDAVSTSCFKTRRFRIGCGCGARGPWATTVRRAIEVWNEIENVTAP